MKISRKLRRIREASGLSLRELARRIQISPTYLSKVETGICLPSEKLLRAICKETDADSKLDMLLVLTGTIPEDVVQYLVGHPDVLERLRREMAAA
jgi:transcriptional regulator with XRE-family HTH domain